MCRGSVVVSKCQILFQARVMRDMRNVDAQGIGKSKEFGFVSFTTHDHALQALRNINNNPNIFTSARVRIPVIWHCL